MISNVNSRKKMGENSGNGKLLNDIEAINKALYLDKNRPRSTLHTVSSRYKALAKSNLPDSKSKNKDDNKDFTDKEKKSIWSWKSLKSFTHVRNRRFNCCFSLQVHSIEGLPPLFDDLSIVVHWKRRDGELVTCPVTVFKGVAEFEEQLLHSCSIYGSRNGPQHSAKYEAKHFLVYASVCGTPELDLGKHRVDLTRLLPLTLEELEEEKSSTKWTTSYRLSGKAKGAILNVSYGYEIIDSNKTENVSEKDVSLLRKSRQNSAGTLRRVDRDNEMSLIPRTGSLPTKPTASKFSSEDVKDLHEVFPLKKSELSDSINLLYKKFEEEKLNIPIEPAKSDLHLSFDANKENTKDEYCVAEFPIRDNGSKAPPGVMEKSLEDTEVNAHGSAGGSSARNDVNETVPEGRTLEPSVFEGHQDKLLTKNDNYSEAEVYNKELPVKELDSTGNSVSDFVKEELESCLNESDSSNRENHMEHLSDNRTPEKGKSLSFDDSADAVASEFFDFLGMEHSPCGLNSESEPESPRERLLRQFEKDVLTSGSFLFDFVDEDESDMGCGSTTESNPDLFSQDYYSYSAVYPSEELPKIEPDITRHKTKASMLEDLETEVLMHEWGLNEKSFQRSPSSSSCGYGSPVHVSLESHDQLPPLGEGLGPFIQTENGGFLRSMNPDLFRNAKAGGSLIMQVSSPVVMPADMGSGVMDILQHLASVGIEKLSMQANKLMPLDDVNGKTMQHIAWEAAHSLEEPEREDLLQHESRSGQSISGETGRVKKKSSVPKKSKFESNAIGGNKDSEYVSLEDLAPLAMDKIEALAIEGLRIQSGMSDEDAPANISPQSIGEFSALQGKMVNSSGSLGLEGAGGLQLLDVKDNGEDIDGLMALSLTLDEWMKLDSGEIYDGDSISEHTSKLLAAHHASSMELIRGRSKGEKRRSKGKGKNCGLLGNNFTVALMVQLRDPLRNYEPVGTPMLALIQVERVFLPPKPRIYCAVSEVRARIYEAEAEPSSSMEDEQVVVPDDEDEEEQKAQFKITEVHVAGLKVEPGKKKLWGSSTQQQSGSRWLLANGMGKKNKHPFMKSKTKAGGGVKASLPTTTTTTAASSSTETTTVQQQQQQPSESLWSLSSSSNKKKESAGAGARIPHIRNPNISFSSGFGKLKLR